jgi:hypothetical protein
MYPNNKGYISEKHEATKAKLVPNPEQTKTRRCSFTNKISISSTGLFSKREL